jgi:hypothetical protein
MFENQLKCVAANYPIKPTFSSGMITKKLDSRDGAPSPSPVAADDLFDDTIAPQS